MPKGELVQENSAIVRSFIEETINQGHIDSASRFVWDDVVEQVPFPGQGPGIEGLKDVLRGMRAAFPDMHWSVAEQIAEGDKVVTRFTARGTHRGVLGGVAPSGRFVTVPCLSIDRIVGGQIVESFELFDQLGMFQAIGTLPALSASA